MAQSLDASSGGAAVFALAAAFGGLATALAFAGVFAFAAVITGLATALPLTIVLTFASMLAFIDVSQAVEGGTCCAGNAGSVGADSEGSGQKTGNCSAGYDRFGWFHCLSTFSLFGFMVVIFATRN